jgi:hypothetical protein
VCFVSGEWEQAVTWWKKALDTKPEPGQEPLNRERAARKVEKAEGLLAAEARDDGAPRKSADRIATPLVAP